MRPMYDKFVRYEQNLMIMIAPIRIAIGTDTVMRNVPIGIVRSLRVMYEDNDRRREGVQREENTGAGRPSGERTGGGQC